MAETTYYAWAPIHHKDEDGKPANVAVGKQVHSELLDSVDDETREAWINDGVIRTAKFPDDVPEGMSVRTHLLRKANEAYERAQAIGSPQPEEPVAEPTTENPQPVGDTNVPADASAPEGATAGTTTTPPSTATQ